MKEDTMESEYVSEYAKVVEAVSRRVSDAATAEAAKWRELGENGTDSAEAADAGILRIADVFQAAAVELREAVERVREARSKR
jgi:hypothetical protein